MPQTLKLYVGTYVRLGSYGVFTMLEGRLMKGAHITTTWVYGYPSTATES